MFLLISPVFAENKSEEDSNEKNIVVKKDEVINRDFFGAGENVTISGTVNGDVYAAGGAVFVDGKINGDLLIGGGTITLLGEVSDDVRVGGGNILIEGTIGKNLTVVGGNITVTKEAKINGSLLVLGGNLEVVGDIGRDANVYVGRALFGGQVGGDLKGSIAELSLASDAQVLGNLEYESEKEAKILEGATVSGKILYKPSEEKEVKKISKLFKQKPEPFLKSFKKVNLFLKFVSFLVSLFSGYLLLRFFPKKIMGMTKILESHPWKSLGVGFLTPFVFVALMIFLALTIIGIPFVALFVIVFVFFLYLSKIFVSFCLGRFVLLRLNYGERRGWALCVGLLVYYLAKLIPVIGLVITLGFTFSGLGAFVLDSWSVQKSSLKKKSRRSG